MSGQHKAVAPLAWLRTALTAGWMQGQALHAAAEVAVENEDLRALDEAHRDVLSYYRTEVAQLRQDRRDALTMLRVGLLIGAAFMAAIMGGFTCFLFWNGAMWLYVDFLSAAHWVFIAVVVCGAAGYAAGALPRRTTKATRTAATVANGRPKQSRPLYACHCRLSTEEESNV